MSESNDLTPVSVTQGDRVLTGVGADPEQLAQTMERHDTETPIETTAAPESAEPHGEKPTRGQKRFSQLTSERDKERNAREAAERERDELRAQLAARSAPPTQAANGAPPPVQRPPEAAAPAEPDFEKDYEGQVGTKYSTYAQAIQAFNRDYAKWSQNDIDARVRDSIEADRASRTAVERETQEIARGRSRYADFDAVVTAPHLAAAHWPDAIVQAVNSLPEPEHIRYALGKDPALAEKIRTMNPILVGMELAKLMPAPAVVSPASTAGAGSVVPPPPYQPVGSGSKTTAPPLADLPKRGGFDYDKSGYRERRADERGVRRH